MAPVGSEDRAAAVVRADSAGPAMRLRIVTYNIHKGVGTDGLLDVRRVAEIVRHYDPHVVCLQEVLWNPPQDGERTQPQDLREAIGLPHAVVALNCHRPQGTYGNMTLSKFPIDEHENLDLTMPLRKTRAALYTRIRLPHAPLHVFNAHLGLAGYERLRQMRLLVEDTPRLAPERESVVYLGDMNDWQHRIYGDVLVEAGFRCAVGDRDDPGHSTFPSRMPVAALDKVFVRGAVTAVHAHPSRLALARVASDHLPLVAELLVAVR
jgi:endonuclease/exonuclease/phosphatase family metal-dependent hydrolase